MGLLEKALAYKNKINRDGQKSIMDRISGAADRGSEEPAGPDTDLNLNFEGAENDDVLFLRKEDLTEIKSNGTSEAVPRKSPQVNGDEMDYPAFFELSRDILGAESKPELFDVILFSIMGQIGVTSSSIMVPCGRNGGSWEIVESRGVHINKDEISFSPSAGILGQMMLRKEIIDIEEYRDHSVFIDDYYAYIAIDARILVPLLFKSEVMGVVILGNKLIEQDFTAEEKNFLSAIGEFSAFSYRAMTRGALPAEKGDALGVIDEVQRKIASDTRGEGTEEIIRAKFIEQGILSFAVYLQNGAGSEYVLFTCAEEDRLQLKKQQPRISFETAFISEIIKIGGRRQYADLRQTKAAASVFPDALLSRIEMLTVFPHMAEGELIGFTVVFNAERPNGESLGGDAAQVCGFVFPYLYLMHDLSNRRGTYTDSIERTVKRIGAEISYARDLGIPVTLVAITIKNFKRYQGVYGDKKVREMFRHVEEYISARLSDRDFSVRYDRNKVLIVLSGKDKKYAVPLANAVCNELVNNYSTNEAQLLVTFLAAEYPLDGKDTSALIDAVN